MLPSRSGGCGQVLVMRDGVCKLGSAGVTYGPILDQPGDQGCSMGRKRDLNVTQCPEQETFNSARHELKAIVYAIVWV